MSDHDRDATIAVLTRRYADARSAREAHVRTITTIRGKLHEFARNLATVEGFISSGRSIPRMPPDYPTDAQIAATLDELRAVCDELELTEKLLKEAGVNVGGESMSSATLPTGIAYVRRLSDTNR
jgi:hypothetical protein